MSLINTGSVQLALKPLVTEWFGNSYRQLDPQYSKVFEKRTSNSEHEYLTNIHGTGAAHVKPEGTDVRYDGFQQGYNRIVNHTCYGLALTISMEAIMFGRYFNDVQHGIKSLTNSMNNAKENVAWRIFNNSTDTGAANLGGDGLPLLSTAHLLSKGGTQSNRPSSGIAISEIALENARTAIRRYKTDEGFPCDMSIRNLIINPEQEAEVHRILKSPLRYNTANNDGNFLGDNSTYPKVVVSNYIDNTTSWYVQTNADCGLINFEALPLRMDEDKDFNSNNMRYKMIEMYSFTWGDYRCIYGSPGTN